MRKWPSCHVDAIGPFPIQIWRTSLRLTAHILFSRLDTMTRSAESPRLPSPRTLRFPSPRSRKRSTEASQIAPAGSSLSSSSRLLLYHRSWHSVRPCRRATRYTRVLCKCRRQTDVSSSGTAISSCAVWCYAHGCCGSPTSCVAPS